MGPNLVSSHEISVSSHPYKLASYSMEYFLNMVLMTSLNILANSLDWHAMINSLLIGK